jgi:hypothetical protein
VSSYGFVKKSGGFGHLIVISKAVRCGPDNFWDPCDQVALLNALKELEWLTPFDEGSHATSSARTWEGAGAYGTRIRMQTLFGVLLPADGTRTATVGNGDFGTSPLLLGSSRTSRCLPVFAYVGCRAQRTMAGREITR